ncbi:MAG: YbfB/YjiJ family MFS transporter, partial [Comamonadaceae bacterium]
MPQPAPLPRPVAIALAGLVALAVAMGIGRFAFTPILPMMLAEGSVTLPGASLLASANYLGYLAGALACTFQPWLWRRFGRTTTVDGPAAVRAGLAATVMLTLAMAWHAPAAWPWLRFAAGVASSVVFLYTTGWCLDQLARLQVPAMGALIYVGPGGGMPVLALAYGLAGIGYIITATFLPVIARQALPGSHWLDLFWPLLGAGVMAGAFIASRMRHGGDLRLRLAACYLLQAAGVCASLVSPTLAGFAIGSLLLGLPFTTITYFAMQEVRRVRPVNTTSAMGLLTAVYGLGQIAGPPLAAWLATRSATPAQGFALSLWIATGALVAGAGMYLW